LNAGLTVQLPRFLCPDYGQSSYHDRLQERVLLKDSFEQAASLSKTDLEKLSVPANRCSSTREMDPDTKLKFTCATFFLLSINRFHSATGSSNSDFSLKQTIFSRKVHLVKHAILA
jgi:hypothetical protein